MADIATHNISDKQNGKQNAHQRENQHHHIATKGCQGTHARHHQAGIVHNGLQRHSRKTRQHTHSHSKHQHETVLAHVAASPTVDFTVKMHFFKKN